MDVDMDGLENGLVMSCSYYYFFLYFPDHETPLLLTADKIYILVTFSLDHPNFISQ